MLHRSSIGFLAVLISVSAVSAARAELVNYWAFDDSHVDTGSFGYTATVNGSPTFGAAAPIAHSTGSLSLDPAGGYDYLRIGSTSGSDPINVEYEKIFASNFGISLWVQSDVAPSQLATDMAYALDFGAAHGDGVGIHLNKSHGSFTNGTLGGYVDSDRLNGPVITEPATWDAPWWHVAVTASEESDGGSRIRMYIDGQVVSTQHQTFGGLDKSKPLTIGRIAKDNNRGWDGQIDDLSIWTGQLNPRQIQLLAADEASPQELAAAPSWDFRNDHFTASTDPSATASEWRDDGRWRYMYAEIDGAGDVTGTGAPGDFTDMSRFGGHTWDDGSGHPSVRTSDFTVHPDDSRAPVIAWESRFDGTIEYYFELIENNNNAVASPGYQLFHWDQSESLMALIDKVDVFTDDPSTNNDWETLLGTLTIGSGDLLYMAIDDGGNGHDNDRTRINASIRLLPQAAVPEPSSLVLCVLGLLAFVGWRWRKR